MQTRTDFEWMPLIPELACVDLKTSLHFYVDVVGFCIAYDRPEANFAFLTLGRAQLMLEQVNLDRPQDHWITAKLSQPFGRGINFQIEVDDVLSLTERLSQASIGLFEPISEVCYRVRGGDRRQRQLLVQDPDGYLLRFCQGLN